MARDRPIITGGPKLAQGPRPVAQVLDQATHRIGVGAGGFGAGIDGAAEDGHRRRLSAYRRVGSSSPLFVFT
jgi:hypothetical protein